MSLWNPELTTPTAEFVVPKSIPRIISLIAASFMGAGGSVNGSDQRAAPNPVSLMSNGFSSASLLLM